MGELDFEFLMDEELKLESEIYQVDSIYEDEAYKNIFINLRANVVDLNPAMVTKCIQGTEQDFIMLMNKAKDFLEPFKELDDKAKKDLLQMFQDCVFGYYILTPLLNAKDVSDIKILAWNHIVCKSYGDRYLTNLSFFSEDDYNRWFERQLRIHRLSWIIEDSLQYCTDRKGIQDYYLRIDTQLDYVISTEANNIHIRKIPKHKFSWRYLMKENMLTQEMINYIRDRVGYGYGFLISGRGGSGKSTLLNSMLDIIPFNESVLVVQESDELYSEKHPQIQFEHTLELSKKDGVARGFSLEDELRLGLLQDIDNFVIGEIKGGEALYCFTTAMSTGARFFGTIHSNDAVGSVRRLAQCARYISDYPMETLEEMLTSTPFCLIHMSRFAIDEILEIRGWDEARKCLIYHQVYKKKTILEGINGLKQQAEKAKENKRRNKKRKGPKQVNDSGIEAHDGEPGDKPGAV